VGNEAAAIAGLLAGRVALDAVRGVLLPFEPRGLLAGLDLGALPRVGGTGQIALAPIELLAALVGAEAGAIAGLLAGHGALGPPPGLLAPFEPCQPLAGLDLRIDVRAVLGRQLGGGFFLLARQQVRRLGERSLLLRQRGL